MSFHFYFYHDVIPPNQAADLDSGIRNRQLVVMHGRIEVGMQTVDSDCGIYFGGPGKT